MAIHSYMYCIRGYFSIQDEAFLGKLPIYSFGFVSWDASDNDGREKKKRKGEEGGKGKRIMEAPYLLLFIFSKALHTCKNFLFFLFALKLLQHTSPDR